MACPHIINPGDRLAVTVTGPPTCPWCEIARLLAALDEADALLGETIGLGAIGPVAYPIDSNKTKAMQSYMRRCVERGDAT